MVTGAEFGLLLDSFDEEPVACAKVLRAYWRSDPAAFAGEARQAMLNRPLSRALKCIATLLLVEGAPKMLLDHYASSRDEAIAVAKKILVCQPQFDVTLIEYVEGLRLMDRSTQAILSTLDVLDEISERDRLVLNILALLKHPNPLLRSKAALMIGRRRPNAAWIKNLENEPDPRVRANAIESLFQVREVYSTHKFHVHANDSNNRVAGNARLGLFLHGDTSSVELIQQLALDDRPNFRNTGAWVMGRTQAPRFSPILSQLINDPDERVRQQAFRSLGEIRKALKCAASKDPLRITFLKHDIKDAAHSLWTAICAGSGRPVENIPGTGFTVRVDGQCVPVYSVEERPSAKPLNLAFIMCLPKDDEELVNSQFEAVLESCSQVRRTDDRWAVIKFTRNKHWARFGQTSLYGSLPITGDRSQFYSNDPEQAKLTLQNRPVYLAGSLDDETPHALARDLLAFEFGTDSPHIVIVGDTPDAAFIQLLNMRRQSNRFAVHAVVREDLEQPALLELVEKTGGIFKIAAKPQDFVKHALELYSSFIHHYEIEWTSGAGNEGGLELEVDTPDAHGTLTRGL